MKDDAQKINCFHCVHYAVTWEPNMPRACKLYGFKSAQMPSLTVFQSTGSDCVGFERKGAPREDRP